MAGGLFIGEIDRPDDLELAGGLFRGEPGNPGDFIPGGGPFRGELGSPTKLPDSPVLRSGIPLNLCFFLLRFDDELDSVESTLSNGTDS